MMIFSKFTKNNIFYYTISFLLPFFILFFMLLSKDIYWGSKTTILASDGFHQYVIFAQNLRNILHGKDSIFYTFTSGLGLNFYALISYYLGSFFSPLVYFFDLKNMPDALYLFTLLKIACAGLSASFSLRKLYPRVNNSLILVLSTSYALMSFTISQLEINMWLDVFILIPLIILGLNQVLTQRKFLLYYISLTILFIQNYYFGFMAAIFLVLYFLVQLTKDFSLKSTGRRLMDFTVLSLLAGLSSSIILLPTYLDLSTHGEKFTTFTGFLTEKSWLLDIFAKNIVGSYDTTKFGAIPMIYVGILPLFLALTYFTIKSIKWQTRLAYLLMLNFIVISFYLQPLDLAWQGMHAPNMFLHRYAWTFSILIILLAAETLSHLSELTLKQFVTSATILGIGFLATLFFREKYDFLQYSQFILSFAFLSAYTILLFSYSKKQFPYRFFLFFTLLFALIEISLNTYYQVNALGNEWTFPSRDGYKRNLTDIDKLVKFTKKKEQKFFRTERLLPQTGNDSMKYDYNGISQFSSIRNRSSSSTLDRLGFQSTGTNLNLRYQNNTLIADSLFALKYNLTESSLDKFGFSLQKTSGQTSLYKNQYASQLAILTNDTYKDTAFTVNTLDNQTSLLNNLTGLSERYFSRLSAQLLSGQHLLNNRINLSNTKGSNNTVTYQMTIVEPSQVYVSVPSLTLDDDKNKTVQITINGQTKIYTTDNAYSFFDLGYFNAGQTVEVTFSFPEQNQVSFNSPNFYALNISSYQKAMSLINSKQVSVKTKSNNVTVNYRSKKKASLFFTIPYDKGWTATLNEKKIKLLKAQNGFMKADVPKGKGKVILTFIPNGFKEASLLSLLGIALFVLYFYFTAKSNSKLK